MLNLLIGESQPFLAESYYEKLTNLGHHVAMCKEGKECIDKYQELLKESLYGNNSLDIVIVDELIDSGLETIDEILSINSKQKVLFITSYQKSILDQKTSNISIIEKPFSMYSMIQKLEELESK